MLGVTNDINNQEFRLDSEKNWTLRWLSKRQRANTDKAINNPLGRNVGRWGQAVSADHAVTLSWQISTGHWAILKFCSPFLPIHSVSAASNCTDPHPQTRKTSVLYHISSFWVLFFSLRGVVSLSPRIWILLNLLTLETLEYTEFRFPRDEGCLKKKKKKKSTPRKWKAPKWFLAPGFILVF